MQNYITVNVPPDLLPQVTGELLQFTRNPDLVEVAFTEVGRVIHADPDVVDAWMDWRQAREEAAAVKADESTPPVTEPEPVATEPEPVPKEPEPVVPDAPVARKK